MAIIFPGGLDNFTNPTPADTLSSPAVLHTDQHSDLNDAVEALEAKVGINGSLITGTFDYRISNLSSTTSGLVSGSHSPVTLGTANGLSLTGQVLSMALSATGTTGALSGVDWSTFNSKQSALSFPLAANLGGTGILNSGTFTNQSNLVVTGGGTVALGGFTLTVPATGTAALLATENVFTVAQMVDGSADAVQLRVQGHSTQTVNILTVEKSDTGILVKINKDGGIRFGIDGTTGLAGGLMVANNNVDGSATLLGGIYRDSSNMYFGTYSSSPLFFISNNTIGISMLTSAGAVGIGNDFTTPLARLHVQERTATTNAVQEVVRLEAIVTSSTPSANGFGSGLSWYAETATNATNQQQGEIKTSWIDATNASRKATLSIYAYDTVQKFGADFAAEGTLTNAITRLGAGAGKITFSAAADYTLTIPASLTAAGLAVQNIFTALQTVALDDSSTNTVLPVLKLQRTSTGTPANNEGLSLEAYLETTSTILKAAEIQFIAPVVNTSLATEIRFFTRNGGSYNEAMRIDYEGTLRLPVVGSGPRLVATISSALTGLAENTAQELIRFTQASATANNWSNFAFYDANNAIATLFATQYTDHTNHYGELVFATRGTTGFNERFRVGTNGLITANVYTTTTNAVVEAGRLQSSVSTAATGGANGFGIGLSLYAETATDGTSQQQGLISTSWIDATNASRKAKMSLSAYDTAARLGMEIEASGSAVKLGFFGHATSLQSAAYTPTNVTTDRSYDANSTSIDEIADVLGTLIADLQSLGLVA